MGKVIKFGRGERRRDEAERQALEEACYEDLAKSGISPVVAEKLGIKVVDADEAWALVHPKKPHSRAEDFTIAGWAIPYLHPDGTALNYWRVRAVQGKWDAKRDYRKRRYGQAGNTLPHLYVPWPLLDFQYDKATGNVKLKSPFRVVTEGEKKAIASCLVGIPCLAVGGVDSFASTKHDVGLLEEFAWFDWSALDAEVCFDSDIYNKPEARQAMNKFCYQLRTKRQPRSVKTVRLTSETSGNTALDDFLMQYKKPIDAQRAYSLLPRTEDPIQEAFALFNSALVHARRKQAYYNMNTDIFYKSQSHLLQEYEIGLTVRSKDDRKELYPISLWVNERPPEITTVQDVIYAPGKPPRFLGQAADQYPTLNTWTAGEFQVLAPRRNGKLVKPYLEFIAYMTPELDDVQRGTLIDWLAYPLQNIGGKMDFAVLVVSPFQGTGKNTLIKIHRPMYGRQNVSEIKGSSLKGTFNEYTQKQLIVINEVHVSAYGERLSIMNDLKTLITEDAIDLSRKYLPRENVTNVANLYLTSNYLNALTLESDDRRFFVIRAPDAKARWTKERFSEFNDWLENGGTEEVYRYLMGRDLSGFNPHMDAPKTVARQVMIKKTYSPLDDLVQKLFDDPDSIVAAGGYLSSERRPDLYEPQIIVECLAQYAKNKNLQIKNSVAILGTAMGKFKFAKRIIEIKRNGRRCRVTLYALYNSKSWRGAADGAWRKSWFDSVPKLRGKGSI